MVLVRFLLIEQGKESYSICNIDKRDRGYVIRLLGGEYDYNGKIVDGVEMGFMSKFWK